MKFLHDSIIENNDFLAFAQELAKSGGKILARHFGKLSASQIELKSVHDLVTDLDRQVEAMYVKEIKKNFPKHGIIGEEGGSKKAKSEFVWVLDPLDGTRNYTMQIPFYGTTVCLLRNQEPIVAVIYVPSVGKLYYATKNGGAFVNNHPIHVSDKRKLIKSSILYCHTPDERGIRNAEKYSTELKVRASNADRLRAAGPEMGLVAEGLAEAYLLDGLPLWDLAAGALLIKEAGGKVTDFTGKEWVPGDRNILLSNGTEVHGEILKLLSSVL